MDVAFAEDVNANDVVAVHSERRNAMEVCLLSWIEKGWKESTGA